MDPFWGIRLCSQARPVMVIRLAQPTAIPQFADVLVAPNYGAGLRQLTPLTRQRKYHMKTIKRTQELLARGLSTVVRTVKVVGAKVYSVLTRAKDGIVSVARKAIGYVAMATKTLVIFTKARWNSVVSITQSVATKVVAGVKDAATKARAGVASVGVRVRNAAATVARVCVAAFGFVVGAVKGFFARDAAPVMGAPDLRTDDAVMAAAGIQPSAPRAAA